MFKTWPRLPPASLATCTAFSLAFAIAFWRASAIALLVSLRLYAATYASAPADLAAFSTWFILDSSVVFSLTTVDLFREEAFCVLFSHTVVLFTLLQTLLLD
jgi:hypothetical protein